MNRSVLYWAGRVWVLLMMAGAGLPEPAGAAESKLFEGDWATFQKTEAGRAALDPGEVRTNVMALAILHATNAHRREHGLPALKFHTGARDAAAIQARIMQERGSISHENPGEPNYRTLQDRAEAVGLRYRYLAENVATAFDCVMSRGKRSTRGRKTGGQS